MGKYRHQIIKGHNSGSKFKTYLLKSLIFVYFTTRIHVLSVVCSNLTLTPIPTSLRHIPLRSQNESDMMTQCHKFTPLIENDYFDIKSPIFNHLTPASHKQPLQPFFR